MKVQWMLSSAALSLALAARPAHACTEKCTSPVAPYAVTESELKTALGTYSDSLKWQPEVKNDARSSIFEIAHGATAVKPGTDVLDDFVSTLLSTPTLRIAEKRPQPMAYYDIQNNCQYRAEVAAMLLHKQHPDWPTGKLWASATRDHSLSVESSITWGYHVAPVVLTVDGPRVIDPAVDAAHGLKPADWLKHFAKESAAVEVRLTTVELLEMPRNWTGSPIAPAPLCFGVKTALKALTEAYRDEVFTDTIQIDAISGNRAYFKGSLNAKPVSNWFFFREDQRAGMEEARLKKTQVEIEWAKIYKKKLWIIPFDQMDAILSFRTQTPTSRVVSDIWSSLGD